MPQEDLHQATVFVCRISPEERAHVQEELSALLPAATVHVTEIQRRTAPGGPGSIEIILATVAAYVLLPGAKSFLQAFSKKLGERAGDWAANGLEALAQAARERAGREFQRLVQLLKRDGRDIVESTTLGLEVLSASRGVVLELPVDNEAELIWTLALFLVQAPQIAECAKQLQEEMADTV